MLTAEARSRLTVVLVGARNPNNIGAAARAMQDFGFRDLRVVNEFAAPFEAAVLESAAAVAADEVMRGARRFGSLAEAIADCRLVVGTTAVGERQMRQSVVPVQQGAEAMLSALVGSDGRVALLFGSEKTGLTKEQLSFCNVLTSIPLYEPEGARHLSMNLGQAVAVCLYELTRGGFEGAKEVPAHHEAASSAEDRERLTQLLLDVLHATGYTRRFPTNASEAVVRQLAMQLGTTHREAMTWMGILRQVLWRERGE
jgi:tRNA/rRNA methyltransferase